MIIIIAGEIPEPEFTRAHNIHYILFHHHLNDKHECIDERASISTSAVRVVHRWSSVRNPIKINDSLFSSLLQRRQIFFRCSSQTEGDRAISILFSLVSFTSSFRLHANGVRFVFFTWHCVNWTKGERINERYANLSDTRFNSDFEMRTTEKNDTSRQLSHRLHLSHDVLATAQRTKSFAR